MHAAAYIAIGVVGGIVLAAFLMNGSSCCAALGKAGLSRYNLPDLGTGGDSFFGGVVSSLHLV